MRSRAQYLRGRRGLRRQHRPRGAPRLRSSGQHLRAYLRSAQLGREMEILIPPHQRSGTRGILLHRTCPASGLPFERRHHHHHPHFRSHRRSRLVAVGRLRRPSGGHRSHARTALPHLAALLLDGTGEGGAARTAASLAASASRREPSSSGAPSHGTAKRAPKRAASHTASPRASTYST